MQKYELLGSRNLSFEVHHIERGVKMMKRTKSPGIVVEWFGTSCAKIFYDNDYYSLPAEIVDFLAEEVSECSDYAIVLLTDWHEIPNGIITLECNLAKIAEDDESSLMTAIDKVCDFIEKNCVV